MIHSIGTILIVVILLIAIVAVAMWFVQKVGIGPPLIYVIYAGVAVLCILVLLWLLDQYAGGTLHVSGLNPSLLWRTS
jgi:hypothetical protein